MKIEIDVDEPLFQVLQQVADEEDTPLVTMIEYFLDKGVERLVRPEVWEWIEKERGNWVGDKPF